MIETFDDGPDASAAADVAIVGAGIAGLILAKRLAERGRSVIVLETGHADQGGDEVDGVHPLNAVDITGEPYAGATLGRARGLGGTSTRWGGALLPYLPQDLEARPDLGRAAWPVAFNQLAPHLGAVERLFGLAPGPFEPRLTGFPDQGFGAFVVREAKWPSFARRNVARLVADRIASADGPRVVLGAHVVALHAGADGRVAGLSAVSPDGRHTLTVTTGAVVLATGAVEATRQLLWFDRATDGRALAGRAALGTCFHDHLSVPLATVATQTPAWLNHLAAFRFDRGTMRSVRFELDPARQRAAGVGAGFVHIAPRALARSGFDDIRDFFRSVQQRRPDPKAIVRAAADAPYLAELVRWRVQHKRLYWPRPAEYEVHFVVEQAAVRHNRITLAARTDRFGIPLASIAWRRTEADLAAFRALGDAFSHYFAATALSRTGTLAWRRPPGCLSMADIAASGDIYHPVGSTRMAAAAADGVVDGDLAVFGVPNLYVAATSAFPNVGGANPTMMLAALALRLAERL